MPATSRACGEKLGGLAPLALLCVVVGERVCERKQGQVASWDPLEVVADAVLVWGWQGLGCSNRIIVSHDLSNQPRVAERAINPTPHHDAGSTVPLLVTTGHQAVLV